MEWEIHIEWWSRVPVKLLDIRQFCMEKRTVPDCYVAPASFFVVTMHGEANISLSGIDYHLCSPHILHGGKDAELDFVSIGPDFSCYLILYNAEYQLPEDRKSFCMSYAFTPYMALPLQEKCQTMNRLWQLANPIDKLQVQSVFLPFVYEVMRQIRTSTIENSKPNVVTEAINYIHEYYRKAVTAEELAGTFNCSASYLSRLFKNQIGIGPIEYLIHIRIQKSKQLLLKSKDRIQDIASSVGYADVYYSPHLFNFERTIGR